MVKKSSMEKEGHRSSAADAEEIEVDFQPENETNVQTELKQALRDRNSIKVKDLVKNHGASLPLTGKLIINLPPEDIEELLDEYLTAKGSVLDGDFTIDFDYSLLLPISRKPEKRGTKIEDPDDKSEKTTRQKEKRKINESDLLVPETQLLWYIRNSVEHCHLLKHPVVASFLWLKWQCVRRYFYVNSFFHFWYVAFLTLYIMGQFRMYKGDFAMALTPYIWYILVILLAFLMIREFCELLAIRKRYFYRLDNCLESSVALLSLFLIVPYNYNDYEHQLRQLSAVIMLMAWGSFMMLIGKHPQLCTYCITTFNTVASKLTLGLIWYFPLMYSWAVAFSFLFYKQGDESATRHFKTSGLALSKIAVMFTGEIGYKDFPMMYDIGYLAFVLYLFLNNFVLANVLNGFAVTDVQKVASEAEISSLSSRVETIFHMETWLFWKGPQVPQFLRNCCDRCRCCRADCWKSGCCYKCQSRDSGTCNYGGCCKCLFTPFRLVLEYYKRKVVLIPKLPQCKARCYPNETKRLAKQRVMTKQPEKIATLTKSVSYFRVSRNWQWLKRIETFVCEIFGLRMSEAILSDAKSRFLKSAYQKPIDGEVTESVAVLGSSGKYFEVIAKLERLENRLSKVGLALVNIGHKPETTV